MYVSENEIPVQKWFIENNQTPPQGKTIADIFALLEESPFPVERAFNHLPPHCRDLLKALADIDPTKHYTFPNLSGDKLEHYNRAGRDQLFEGLSTMMEIRLAFPRCLKRCDFYPKAKPTRGTK